MTIEQILEKAAKGEKLSDDEARAVMSSHEEPPAPGEFPDDGSGAKPAKEVHIKGLDEDTPPKEPKKDSETKPAETPQGGEKKEGDKKTEEGAAKKPEGQPSEPDKAGDKEAEKPEEGLDMAKLDAELSKAPGQEDLSGFTKRERGYFYELRSQRRRSQEAENKARTLEFELAKAKKDLEASKKKDDEKDDEDVATQGDLKKVSEEQKRSTVRMLYEQRSEIDFLRHQSLPFFAEVMALADKETERWLTAEDKKDVQEAMNKIMQGGSPHKVVYDKIVNHPNWPTVKAKLDAAKAGASKPPQKSEAEEKKIKEEEAKAAAAALEKNAKKAATTGQGGSEGGDDSLLEFDMDKLYNMSPQEFGKLPKATQEAILRKLDAAG
jgi:hypothetical protein